MCSLSRNVATLFTLYNASFSLTWEDGLNRIYLALLEIWKFTELFYLIGFFVCLFVFLKSSLVEKAMRVLMDTQLNMSHEPAKWPSCKEGKC